MIENGLSRFAISAIYKLFCEVMLSCAHARFNFTKNMTPQSIAYYRPNGLIFRIPRDCGQVVLSEGVGAVDHPAAPGHSPVNSVTDVNDS